DRKIQSGFYFSGNTLCGMQSGDGILHRDYILHFLQNQGIGTFIPGPGFSFRHKLTPEEKDFYSLKRETGVIVEEVFPGSGGYNILFPGDSIVAVNGIALKKFSEGDLFQEVLKEILLTGYGLRKRDSPVRLSVYRNRKKMEIEYHLIPLDLNQKFIPENLNLQKEKFILTGGFVFTELSGEYLKEHGEDYKNNSNRKLLYLYENYRGKKNPEKERLVILAKVIESKS
ncbi:MAG: serine protease, partial [Leptospira sp.]|nr:serine protease [Leptospira sp.]